MTRVFLFIQLFFIITLLTFCLLFFELHVKNNKLNLNDLYRQLNSTQQHKFIAAFFVLKYDKKGNEIPTQILNPTHAARVAGYSFPRQESYRLLRHPVIKQIVSIYLEEMAMPKSEILARLSEQARGSITEFITDDGQIDIRGVRTHGHLVRKFTFRKKPSKQGLIEEQEVELYDAQKAMIAIGKHHGLWRQKKEEASQVNFEVIAGSFDVLVGLMPESEEEASELSLLPAPDSDDSHASTEI